MQRLSDSEVAEKTRVANRRRAERKRARLAADGKFAFTVWIPADLQRQIVGLATAEQATTSNIATRLLSDSLACRQPQATAKAAPGALAERDALIVTLHNQGKSLRQIAAALAEKGYLTLNGTPLSNDTIGNALKRLSPKKENS